MCSFYQNQSVNEVNGSTKNLNKHNKRMSLFEKSLESIYPRTEDTGFVQNSPKWSY